MLHINEANENDCCSETFKEDKVIDVEEVHKNEYEDDKSDTEDSDKYS